MAGYAVNTENPHQTEADYTLEAQTLQEAGEKGLGGNPTFYRAIQMIRYIPEDSRPDSATIAHVQRFHRDVLRELRGQDVPIVIGADAPLGGAFDTGDVVPQDGHDPRGRLHLM